MKPLVSIIIPTFNRAHLIGETLDSVIVQTYKNWECIVVDDSSTDYTDELLEFYCQKDSRIQYHHRPKNRIKGANACRNYAFELSEGEFIIFLDSDDLLVENAVKNRVGYFKADTDFLIFNTGTQVNNEKTNHLVNKDPIILTNASYLRMFLRYNLPWQTSSVIWKRNILRTYAFDENLQRLQDVDFHVRILNNSQYSFQRIFELDNFYRIDTGTRDKKHNDKVITSFMHLVNKFYSSPLLDNYKKDFRVFVIFFLEKFLYPNGTQYSKEIMLVEQNLIEKGKLNYIQKRFLIIKMWMDSNGIKFKGYGRLRKTILKKIA